MFSQKKTIITAGVLLAIAIGALWIVNPFKVTDPSDPRFDPDKFKFSDYNGRDELIPVYKKLFPVGTPKEFVDRVLVQAGGATCYQNKTHIQLWNCRQPKTLKHWDVGPVFSVIYDENMKLLNFIPGGWRELYPENITVKDLVEEYNQSEETGE